MGNERDRKDEGRVVSELDFSTWRARLSLYTTRNGHDRGSSTSKASFLISKSRG